MPLTPARHCCRLPVLYALLRRLAAAAAARSAGAAGSSRRPRRCLPERNPTRRRRIARDFYRYLGELVAEVVHGARITPADLVERLRFENADDVAERARQRPARADPLAAHHCNWEWLLLRCSSAFGTPLVAAYKPPAASGRPLAADMRSRFGATMVPAQGDRAVPDRAARRQVKLLAMVADQSPAAANEQQVWLPFFGQETAFFQGPGWIGAKMGFQPVFIAMRPEGRGRYVVRFVPLARTGRAAGSGADPECLRARARGAGARPSRRSTSGPTTAGSARSACMTDGADRLRCACCYALRGVAGVVRVPRVRTAAQRDPRQPRALVPGVAAPSGCARSSASSSRRQGEVVAECSTRHASAPTRCARGS